MRKSVVVRNNYQSTYRFVEKAPKGKVFQLHSALLLNVSNISSKKTKTFVGDIELRSRPVTCTAEHSGPFLMKKFAKLDFWTKTTLSTPVLFFLSWIRLLPGQNVNESRILGSFGWKEKAERLKKWPSFRSEYPPRGFLFLFFFKISSTYHCYQIQFFAPIFW